MVTGNGQVRDTATFKDKKRPREGGPELRERGDKFGTFSGQVNKFRCAYLRGGLGAYCACHGEWAAETKRSKAAAPPPPPPPQLHG